jgi:hypothetical protein
VPLSKERRHRMIDSGARRKRNMYAATVVVLAVALLVSIFMWGTAAAQRGEVAQSNAQTLAEQVKQACSSGQLVVDDRNLCEKAGQIAASPDRLVPGPPGPQGVDGKEGKDGASGAVGVPGRDSTVPGPASTIPGPAGRDGIDGRPGADSTVPGLAGPPGADSTTPGPAGKDSTVPGPAGPAGPQGPPGANGTNGTSPSSFTFTDRLGMTYTCTPNPPGSSTYTCASDGLKP